jgi:hypothetical protein
MAKHPELFRYVKDHVSKLEFTTVSPSKKASKAEMAKFKKAKDVFEEKKRLMEESLKTEGSATSTEFLLWLVWCHMVLLQIIILVMLICFSKKVMGHCLNFMKRLFRQHQSHPVPGHLHESLRLQNA